MDKVKLMICIKDEEYESRFVKCVMNHYKELYEIHVFDHMSEFIENRKKKKGIFITGDGNDMDLFSAEEGSLLFVLQENMKEYMENTDKGIFVLAKYQEVYKVMEQIEKASKEILAGEGSMPLKETEWIGVFSLEYEVLQIPFSALLGEILGEKNRVLMIDLQPYSGFITELEAGMDVLGMEDLMTVAATGNYTNHRLLSSLGHEQKWDYIFPVKNVQCLTEIDAEQYKRMIHILQTERGYEKIILNFGAGFSGVTEFMEDCNQFYFLTGKKKEHNWREQDFFTKMRILNGDSFFHKIIWMEMPAGSIRGKTWRMLVKEWLWGELGDQIRELYWLECADESDM